MTEPENSPRSSIKTHPRHASWYRRVNPAKAKAAEARAAERIQAKREEQTDERPPLAPGSLAMSYDQLVAKSDDALVQLAKLMDLEPGKSRAETIDRLWKSRSE